MRGRASGKPDGQPCAHREDGGGPLGGCLRPTRGRRPGYRKRGRAEQAGTFWRETPTKPYAPVQTL